MQYLLDNRLLTKSAIKYHITASMTLKTDTFKEFLQVVFSNFTEGVAKELANRFIGNLDGKYDKRHKGFLSTSYDNVCCMWTESVAKGRRVEISHFDNGEGEGLFMAKEIDVQRKLSDNCSVNRQVISKSIIELLELINRVCGENSVIEGYNTAAVYVINPVNITCRMHLRNRNARV